MHIPNLAYINDLVDYFFKLRTTKYKGVEVLKVGDKVKILTGDWKGQIGTITSIHREFPYPICVDFKDGDCNNYNDLSIELIKS